MKLSALLQPLIDAKVPHEIIMQQILAFEAQHEDALEKRRLADAERQARKRERDLSRDVTLRHSDRSLMRVGDAPVDDKPITTQIEPHKENKTPRAALEAVLDADRAGAVIEHRQRIRKPLTGHAAKLLAGKFAQCPDPNAAADTMVGNGWQGFEPEWMAKPTARGSPSTRSGGLGAAFGAIHEHLENGQADGNRSDGAVGPAVLSVPFRRTG